MKIWMNWMLNQARAKMAAKKPPQMQVEAKKMEGEKTEMG